MPAHWQRSPHGSFRFNPRPAVRPGDAMRGFEPVRVFGMFQSAPGREAGRCRVRNGSHVA